VCPKKKQARLKEVAERVRNVDYVEACDRFLFELRQVPREGDSLQ